MSLAAALSLYSGCGIIVAIHAAVLVGVVRTRLRDRRRRATAEQWPHRDEAVSVIVAAMNEEALLPRLLDSLAAQTASDFQVVLIDDRSTDGTSQAMDRFREQWPSRTVVVSNTKDPVGYNGKQQALDLGVQAASGSLLLFTDADCQLPPAWVQQLASHFGDSDVAAAFGPLAVRAGARLLERFQALDQPLMHQYNLGTAGLGLPTGCFGNNLAIRAGVLAEIGGFRALGFTPTEDAALLAAVHRGGHQVRATADEATMIVTDPQPTWLGFLQQHIRWNSGALSAGDAVGRWSYRLIVSFLVASVAALPFAVRWPALLLMPATSLVTIGALGGMAAGALRRGMTASGDRPQAAALLLRVFGYTLLFIFFYALVTVLAAVGVRPRWKGTLLQRRR